MILFSVLAYLVTLGVLVSVHEYGHFWVARKLGVKVLRFSLGFGKPLYTRHFGADHIEFTVGSIPLGGYVKMLDEREGPVATHEQHRAFNRQSLGVRTAVVAAGPLANFAFAIVAFWLMFMYGVSGVAPILGEVTAGSPAERAGLAVGDRLVQVDGLSTPTWEAALHALVDRVIDGGTISISAQSPLADPRELTLDLSSLSIDDVGRGALLDRLGFAPEQVHIPPILGEVLPNGAAAAAGLQTGDEVLRVDDVAIADFNTLVKTIQGAPNQALALSIRRGESELTVTVTPALVEEGGQRIGRIGASYAPTAVVDERLLDVERYGPFAALQRAFEKTASITSMTLRVMGRMVVGEASVKNLSGPISIAEFAGRSALYGLAPFIGFLAAVSISLGVLNLLPIPPLDGGHLLNYLVEFVLGKPLSEASQLRLLQLGLGLLMALTVIALSNDIARTGFNG